MRDQTARSGADEALFRAMLNEKYIKEIWKALELLGLKWEEGHRGRWIKEKDE